MIKDHAKGGVALTTLGVGTDNYKDALMQKLADNGNGNYYYLDTLEEAQKALIDQMSGTLVTIAKDVKIQIEFNPAQVAAYRLIGYEKRKLRTEDFNNDAKEAGGIGAGHTVTALYEVVPAGNGDNPAISNLRYQPEDAPKLERVVDRYRRELLTLKLRYKQPDGDRSQLLEFPITDSGANYNRASADFKFAAAVASFGMILRDSPNRGSANYAAVIELAREAKGADEAGYRAEFINLVQKAQALSHGR
jgi:Ca-activated chloride channel family protein